MVITKDLISFAFVGDDNQIDYIPLAEVEFVKEMQDIANATISDAGGKSDHEDRHRMLIATILTGYNSGRTYQLSTPSKSTLEALLARLSKNAKAARKRAGTKTLFKMLQMKVKKRYDSQITQAIMALMIGAVSAPRAAPRPRWRSSTMLPGECLHLRAAKPRSAGYALRRARRWSVRGAGAAPCVAAKRIRRSGAYYGGAYCSDT